MQCAVCLAVLVLVLCLVRRAAPHVRRTLTPAIVRAVRRDLGLNRWMQGLRCEPLTAAVNASASFVSHPFYIICLPVQLTCFMAVSNYLGQYFKDLIGAPRPLHLARAQLATAELHSFNAALYSREYGLPSVHTSNSLCLYGGLLILLTRSGALLWPSTIATAALMTALVLTTFIAAGRIYSCMHSLTDVLAGAVLGFASLAGFTAALPSLDAWLTAPHAATLAPLQFLAATAALLWLYPKPLRETPSFGDAVVFIGAAGGVLTGALHTPAELYGLSFRPCAQHWQLLGLQALVGVALGVASLEATRAVTQPLLTLLLSAAPPRLRALWQFPVHSHAREGGPGNIGDCSWSENHLDVQKVDAGVPLQADGASAELSTLDRSEPMTSGHAPSLNRRTRAQAEPRARESKGTSEKRPATAELPVDARGRHLDAVHCSRLASYWALGMAVSGGAVRLFQIIGLVRG